jgi:hypothetical protein
MSVENLCRLPSFCILSRVKFGLTQLIIMQEFNRDLIKVDVLIFFLVPSGPTFTRIIRMFLELALLALPVFFQNYPQLC